MDDMDKLRQIAGNTATLGKELDRLRRENALLRTECAAWRACPREHFSKVWDQPQMSGRHRSEYRQEISDARQAVDAAGITLEPNK